MIIAPKIVQTIKAIRCEHPEYKVKDIADDLNVHHSYIYRLNKQWNLGITINKSIEVSDQDREDVIKAYKKGWKVKDILEYFGINYIQYSSICKDIANRHHRWTLKDKIKLTRLLSDGYTVKEAAATMKLGETKVRMMLVRLKKEHSVSWTRIYNRLLKQMTKEIRK